MMDTDSALSTWISRQKCRLERKDTEEEGKAVSPNPTGRQSFGLTPYLCWPPTSLGIGAPGWRRHLPCHAASAALKTGDI